VRGWCFSGVFAVLFLCFFASKMPDVYNKKKDMIKQNQLENKNLDGLVRSFWGILNLEKKCKTPEKSKCWPEIINFSWMRSKIGL